MKNIEAERDKLLADNERLKKALDGQKQDLLRERLWRCKFQIIHIQRLMSDTTKELEKYGKSINNSIQDPD